MLKIEQIKDTVKQRHAEKFALPATVALHGPEPAACINDCSDLRSKRHYKRKTSHKTEHSLGRHTVLEGSSQPSLSASPMAYHLKKNIHGMTVLEIAKTSYSSKIATVLTLNWQQYKGVLLDFRKLAL